MTEMLQSRVGNDHVMTPDEELADGVYDVVVVDATADGDGIHLELTILGGAHKGEVVSVRATGSAIDEVDALAMPGTLRVENGVPAFTFDE